MTTRGQHSRALLDQAAAKAGIPANGAQVIRFGENHLWRLPGGIVARIARPGQQAAAAREIAITRWLAEHRVPAVRPLPIEQPVLVTDRAITFWKELPPHRPGTEAELAPLLRHLHHLAIPSFDIGELDPFVRIGQRLTSATSLSDSDRAWLLDRHAELRATWENLPNGMPRCVIHADAWGGNVAVTDNGQAYLLDFERTSLGPPEWDLTSTAVEADTFGSLPPDAYLKFCQTYGHDVTTWAGYHTLRDIRELRLVTFALQIADDDPSAREQAHYRIACVRGQQGPRPWSWTAVG
jgi:hypothetical protein